MTATPKRRRHSTTLRTLCAAVLLLLASISRITAVSGGAPLERPEPGRQRRKLCTNGRPVGPPEPRHPAVKKLVKLLVPPVNAAAKMEDYDRAAGSQCECYAFGSYRVRPPLMPDDGAPLESVFIGRDATPAFSAGSTYFVISAHISLEWKRVVVLVADHRDGDYRVSGAERDSMRHGSDEVDAYCNFIDHRDAARPHQKLYGPAQILAHDDKHVRTITCDIPESMLACLQETSPTSPTSPPSSAAGGRSSSGNGGRRQPRCLDVALLTGVHGAGAGGDKVTVALLQTCQYDRPERRDFLATCTQPVDVGVFHLLAPWIEHHRRLGVQRFYLYAHGAGMGRHVAPYVDAGLAEVRRWSDPRIPVRTLSQVAAMNHCFYLYMDHAKWIAFFDADEYFHPSKHATLPPYFEPLTDEDVGAVKVYTWYFKHPSADDGSGQLLMSSYLRDEGVSHRYRCKNVIRPSKVQMISVHLVMHGAPTRDISEHELRLNHYQGAYDGKVETFDDGMKRSQGAVTQALQAHYGRTIPVY